MSSTSSSASPARVMAAAAEPTSNPAARPTSSCAPTNTYGIPFGGQLRQVHHDLLRLYILGDHDEFRVPALDGLRRLVRPFLHGSCVAGDLEGFEASVREIRRRIVVYVH